MTETSKLNGPKNSFWYHGKKTKGNICYYCANISPLFLHIYYVFKETHDLIVHITQVSKFAQFEINTQI